MNKGEVFKNNVYYINNNCGSIFYHIEREGVLLEDIKMVDIECDQTDNEVNISTADDLFPAKNTLKIVNAAPFPLKSVRLDGKKYIFDEPLSRLISLDS